MNRMCLMFLAVSVSIYIAMELLKREQKILNFSIPKWLRPILPVVMGAAIMPFVMETGTLGGQILYGVVAGFSSTWTYDLYRNAAQRLVKTEVGS